MSEQEWKSKCFSLEEVVEQRVRENENQKAQFVGVVDKYEELSVRYAKAADKIEALYSDRRTVIEVLEIFQDRSLKTYNLSTQLLTKLRESKNG